jgi:hypothetical protein
VAAPPIDLLAGDFFGEPAKAAYRWMREHAPVYFDDTNNLWGIATYDGVLAAGARSRSSGGNVECYNDQAGPKCQGLIWGRSHGETELLGGGLVWNR